MPGTTEFSRALIPDCWTICGQALAPYSLGHHLAIARICPRILDGSATLKTLLLATRICSKPFNPDDPLSALRVSPLWSVRAACISIVVARRPAILVTRAAMFGAYLTASQQVPKFWRLHNEAPGGSGTPVEVVLLSSLLVAGVPFRDALTMPMSAAWWLLLAHSERCGAIQVDDEEPEEVATHA